MTHNAESICRTGTMMQTFLQRRDQLATNAFAALSEALDWLDNNPSDSDIARARAAIRSAREHLHEIFPALFEVDDQGETAGDMQAAIEAYREFRRAGGFV